MKSKLLILLGFCFLLVGCKLDLNYDLTNDQRIELQDKINSVLEAKSIAYRMLDGEAVFTARGLMGPKKLIRSEFPNDQFIQDFTFSKIKEIKDGSGHNYVGFRFSAGPYQQNYADIKELVIEDDCKVSKIMFTVSKMTASIQSTLMIDDFYWYRPSEDPKSTNWPALIGSSFSNMSSPNYFYSEALTFVNEESKRAHLQFFEIIEEFLESSGACG